MLNKQSLIILVNKFIGQIRLLFSCFAKKSPRELLTKIKSFNIKSLIKYFGNPKPVATIPDGILGISINNNSIALVHLILQGSQIVVKSQQVFVLNAIDVNLQQEAQKTDIENIIIKYIQDNHLSQIKCSYVLSSQQYVLALIELPETQDDKAKEKAILWGVKDYINYSIDDAILEFFSIPINRTQDNAQLAYAVAMRAKLSEEIGKLLKKCNVQLKYIDINELCIRNVMALYSDLQPAYLVLKISDLNHSILLIKDNALFISRSTKLNIKQLDNFDPNTDNTPEKLNIAENLILELQRSIDYANSIFKDLHVNSICILPHNFNLDLFIAWAKEQLGLPINKIYLTQKITFEQNINQQQQVDCLLAIGAALRERDINNVAAN